MVLVRPSFGFKWPASPAISPLALLLPILLFLAAGRGHAQNAMWLDGFDTNNAASRWSYTGAWHIGTPAKGPKGAYSTPYCASTENYAPNQNARIYCNSYNNGSNNLVVPPASVSPKLTFWSWLNLASGTAVYAEIYTVTNGWQTISQTSLSGPLISSGWVQTTVDLSAYAGQSIKIGFHFISSGLPSNSQGWYVDDVGVTVVSSIQFSLTNLTAYAGQTLTVPLAATNVYLPNDQYTYRVISPHPAYVTISSNVLYVQPAANQPSATTNISIRVFDNSSPSLIATNTFTLTMVNPWMPVLTVPSTQTIYAGQSLTVSNSASNSFFPNDVFTFQLVSNSPGMLNLNEPDLDFQVYGTFTWDSLTNQPAGTNKVVIAVTDNSAPYYSSTNSFLIIVQTNPPPPTLTLPDTQYVYPFQTLDVTVSASSVFSSTDFTFALTNDPAGASIDPSTGELTWTPSTNYATKTVTMKVVVTDNTSQLTSQGSFTVIVSPTPPPSLTVPAVIDIYPGQTLAINLTATNNTGLPTTGFNFSLLNHTNDAWIDTTNDILNWTNTGITNGVLVWTNPAVSPGTKTIAVLLQDQTTGITASNHFALLFLQPLPPTLLMPTNWTVPLGHIATNQLFATNSILTNIVFTFTFATAQATTNATIAANGLVTWTNTLTRFGSYSIRAQVADNSQPVLKSTNTFSVHVVPLASQLVLSNASVAGGSRNFKFTLAASWTNSWTNGWVILASTNLSGPATNWLPIYTSQLGGGSSVTFTDLLATNYLRRFYRAMFQ